jgi:hypothetical protein
MKVNSELRGRAPNLAKTSELTRPGALHMTVIAFGLLALLAIAAQIMLATRSRATFSVADSGTPAENIVWLNKKAAESKGDIARLSASERIKAENLLGGKAAEEFKRIYQSPVNNTPVTGITSGDAPYVERPAPKYDPGIPIDKLN